MDLRNFAPCAGRNSVNKSADESGPAYHVGLRRKSPPVGEFCVAVGHATGTAGTVISWLEALAVKFRRPVG